MTPVGKPADVIGGACEIPTKECELYPKPRWLLELNPKGKVPVLVDDATGTATDESEVILDAIAERARPVSAQVWPGSVRARCACARWLLHRLNVPCRLASWGSRDRPRVSLWAASCVLHRLCRGAACPPDRRPPRATPLSRRS